MTPVAAGLVHEVPNDLRDALIADASVLALWEALTPIGRNEFICWVEDAKQAATRVKRIARTCEELHEGQKRPCCWVGCIHREDKAPSRWQQAVLIDKVKPTTKKPTTKKPTSKKPTTKKRAAKKPAAKSHRIER